MGVVLHEAAGGRKPFAGDSAVAVAAAIAAGRPVPLSELNPGVDDALAATVHRALSTRPEDRFESAREMAAALAGGAGAPATQVFAALDEPTISVSVSVSTPAPRRPSATALDRPLLGNLDGPRLRRVGILVGAVLVAVVLFGSFRDGGRSPTAPSRPSTSVTTAPVPVPVPAPLDAAIDALEKAVRR